jgi:hypothetical protein
MPRDPVVGFLPSRNAKITAPYQLKVFSEATVRKPADVRQT